MRVTDGQRNAPLDAARPGAHFFFFFPFSPRKALASSLALGNCRRSTGQSDSCEPGVIGMLAHTLHLRDVPATLDDGQIVADRDVNGPQESFTFDD